MIGRCSAARRRHRRAATLTIAVGLGCGVASAQDVPKVEKPTGLDWGAVVLAPSVALGYGYDSNLFFQTIPRPDKVFTAQPAFVLTVPFSNSVFHLGDTLRYMDYATTGQDHRTANEIFADTSLWFGSLDTLKLSARLTSGAADTIKFDPGGAIASLNGKPYRLDTEEVGIGREIDGARGYRFTVTRNKFVCDDLPFLNYQGFDAEAAYLQPLSPNTRLSFSYVGSLYDHSCSTPEGDLPCRENGDTVFAAVEGNLGPRQPYHIRVGWERLAFGLEELTDFSGVVALADVSASVGAGTSIMLSVQRQPYRVQFGGNSFYVVNQVSTTVDHRFVRLADIGAVASFADSVYPNPSDVTVIDPASGLPLYSYLVYRRDRTLGLEFYANLPIVDRCAFRFSFRKNQRTSSYPGDDYSGTVVSGGIVVGWF